jgi:hypothetical protein
LATAVNLTHFPVCDEFERSGVKDHTRELTYPAVVSLLQDGEWHADEELKAVTSFPQEWLHEVEKERRLERSEDSPHLVRLVS